MNRLFLLQQQEVSTERNGALFNQELRMHGGRSCGAGGGVAVRRESKLPENQRERGGGGKRERSERGEKSFRSGRRSQLEEARQERREEHTSLMEQEEAE